MKLYSKQEAIARMNMLAGCSKSFVFLIDYSQEQVYVEETAEVSPEELIYNLNGFTNEAVAGLTDELLPESLPEQIEWISQSVSFQEYSRAFGHVKKEYSCRKQLSYEFNLPDSGTNQSDFKGYIL